METGHSQAHNRVQERRVRSYYTPAVLKGAPRGAVATQGSLAYWLQGLLWYRGAGLGGYNLRIDTHVLLRHARHSKAPVKLPPTGRPIELSDATDRLHHLVLRLAEQARRAVDQNLGDRAPAAGHHRGTTRQRLDHDQPNGLGPINREEEGQCLAQQHGFLCLINLADEVHQGVRQQRTDHGLKVGTINLIDFGRDP